MVEREADRVKILKDGISRTEYTFVRQDGREVVLESVNIALRDAAGRISGYLATSRDVTERKTHEQEVRDRTVRIELQRRLLEQREQERLKIARDLHDGPVQELTGLTYALEGLAYNTGDPRLTGELQALRAGVQTQIDNLRRFAQELRPPNLVKFGLEKTILSHLDDFREKYPAIQVEFRCELGPERLPDEVRLGLFRIYQEMMTNVAKHSQASQVRILARRTSREVSLEIQDNGVGFAVPCDWLELARAGHLGLVGMQERAEEIGGKWEIDSHPGQGTRIRVAVPVSREATID